MSISVKTIFKSSQLELKELLIAHLKLLKYKPVIADGFIYAKGKLPVLLVCHLDTVHYKQVEQIHTQNKGDVLSSPQGIGGDDRCGVYIILDIIKTLKCSVLFCEDEEIGGLGANIFSQSDIKPDINYIIEFDRAGYDDAVFYDCDNPVFTKFVCDFGFKEQYGSFSDISFIAPALGIAAVNLSSGYYKPHTKKEYIVMSEMRDIITKAKAMITAETGMFEYIEYKHVSVYKYRDDLLDRAAVLKLLMVIEEDNGYIINSNGELRESSYEYAIDINKKVYLLYDDESASPYNTLQAMSHSGLPLQFDAEKAELFEIY